jgi:AbrB family looped-hinge helix DNA binding protein
MPTVVTIDRAGRIVIPKETRDAQNIQPGAKFLLVEGSEGQMWLQRLDPEELVKKIRAELRGVDLAPIVAKIKSEMQDLAAREFPALRRR